MKLYSNAYDYAIYTLNYYEDKYFISLFAHFKHKRKYIITACIPKLLLKKLLFFFTVYENEWKEHKFRQKKIEKSDFYKFKKIFNIDVIDVNKMLVSKNEPYSKKKYT